MSNEIEVAENPIHEESLIVVKQLPVIEEQLLAIKERFSQEAAFALSLECTEDSLQIVKKKRSELTKVYNALEARRKEAKKSILAPYDAFEKVYKECVTDIYSPCDKQLADKIHEVEDGLKAQKRIEVETYFSEYCASKNIDFITFDRIGLNVTMTTSKKALKEQVKMFLDKVSDELALIETQEHRDEILVEYKNSLNVAQAITIVSNRHKAIEAERARAAEANAKAAEEAAVKKTVDEAIQEFAPPKAEQAPPEAEKRYSVSFKVIGTMEQIKSLKEFLVKGEYEYEQQ